ncbi:general transcription factor IIH subunit 3-like [Watersipora subatra]|uniref:general transcription factor IIH subunit 3-like n=1 Tax=Watersipora subatra TaxID=2589382 RepID=UPI00355B936E
MEEKSSLLVLVIDANHIWWGERAEEAARQTHGSNGHRNRDIAISDSSSSQITLTEFIDSVITFTNAHLLTNHRNRLAIIASHASKSQYIYPPRQSIDSSTTVLGATADTLQVLKNSVKGELSHLLSEVDDREMLADSITAGAISMALCYIHKQSQQLLVGEKLNSKILVVKGTEDSSEQYMNFMNAVFTAQKNGVVIDACLFNHDSGLLQQACDITKGIYLRIPHMKGLLQYLLWTFLPDPQTREKMSMPPRSQVDYRAACFCHRRLIDRGYVCSVCLSVFCDFQAICSTCRVPFKILGGPVLRKKKKGP